jgi:hypothetical protein
VGSGFSSKDALHKLHWLPVEYRVDYKIAVLVFKAIHGIAPSYMCDAICKMPEPTKLLRSSTDNANKLLVPLTKCKTFADRSFSVYGPKVWNTLPATLRCIDSLVQFKKQLKTVLFSRAFHT